MVLNSQWMAASHLYSPKRGIKKYHVEYQLIHDTFFIAKLSISLLEEYIFKSKKN